MRTFQVASNMIIHAPATLVYDILADYDKGHREIVPTRYFKALEVLEGGQGEGTKLKVVMSVFGNKAVFNLEVSEPEPGRVLQETDAQAGITTRFTVDSVNGEQSKVEIRSVNRAKPGLLGQLEQMFITAVTKRIYREELAQLNKYAQQIDDV